MSLLARLAMAAALVLLFLLPVLFGQLMVTSLAKLHIDPAVAPFLILGILLGGLINIPVRRIRHDQPVTAHPLDVFGLGQLWPQLGTERRETVIAVNLGGCLIPSGLAVYELIHLAGADPRLLGPVGIAAALNAGVCYLLARPIAGIGIALPALVPPLVAAALALALVPDQAPPAAFIAGVAGPLIGADLLHLKDLRGVATGIASIGGAGTFDGIVLSGIIAAYLA